VVFYFSFTGGEKPEYLEKTTSLSQVTDKHKVIYTMFIYSKNCPPL
jgi:hypothetical protein